MLETAGAYGALLQEGGRQAALPKCRQRADSVIAEYAHRVGKVDLLGSGLKGGKGLPADLVTHVLIVREGPNDDLAVPFCTPMEDHSPAVDGGILGDDHDARQARLTGQESRVQGAGGHGPEVPAPRSVITKHAAYENCGLADGRRVRETRMVCRCSPRRC